MAGTLPINALLGQALAVLDDEYGEPPSLGVWANVLRPIGDGIATRDLPTAARVSKRQVRAAVAAHEKHGFLVTEGRTVRLTPRGAAVKAPADRWPELQPPLGALVRQFALEWPHFPAGYGPADLSATGAPYVGVAARTDEVPPHGDDWTPVIRDGDTTADLPTSALLSQALMQFAAEFEQLSLGGLYYAATIVRLLADEGRPTADFAELARLPGNGKSVLERHLFITISGRPKTARLTARGMNTRDRYDDAVAGVEARWRDRYGDAVLSDVRGALESLDLDPALPHHVVGSLLGYPR